MIPLENAGRGRRLSKAVLATLGETTFEARVQVERMIRFAGKEFVIEMVRKAQETEANGGLFYERKGVSRRRTLGGVFFFLARQALSPELHDKIFLPVEVRWARWKQFRDRTKLRREERARARARAEAEAKAAESAQATVSEPTPLNTEKSAQATSSMRVPSQVPEETPPAPTKANASSSSASLPKPAPLPSKPKSKEPSVIAKAQAATYTSSQRELKPPSPSAQSRGASRGRRREAPKLPEVFVSVRTK